MTPRNCSSVVTHMLTSSSCGVVVPVLPLPCMPLPAGTGEPELEIEPEPARKRTSRPAFESVEGGTFQTTVGTEAGVGGLGRGLKAGRRLRAGFLVGGGGGES